MSYGSLTLSGHAGAHVGPLSGTEVALDRGNSPENAAVRCHTVPMPGGDGWYFLGPLIAVALVGFLCLIFGQLGLQGSVSWDDSEPRSDGLSILGFGDDYGLLCPAALTDDP